ncbi:hypothetical protein EDB85DRAFT_803878 [Lactarius pseudohatsudake]|nr:hypothetical protein EDB85DRAFT_803878 [Lactarius pseudohatsudake]
MSPARGKRRSIAADSRANPSRIGITKMKATGQTNTSPQTCTDPCGILELINDIRTKHFIKRDIKGCLECVCRVCSLLPVQSTVEVRTEIVVLDVQFEILQPPTRSSSMRTAPPNPNHAGSSVIISAGTHTPPHVCAMTLPKSSHRTADTGKLHAHAAAERVCTCVLAYRGGARADGQERGCGLDERLYAVRVRVGGGLHDERGQPPYCIRVLERIGADRFPRHGRFARSSAGVVVASAGKELEARHRVRSLAGDLSRESVLSPHYHHRR